MSTSSVSNSSKAARGRPELPTPEDIVKFALPVAYRVKYCVLCDSGSLDSAVFPGHADCAAWDPLVAWGNGKKLTPAGVLCRVCKYVFVHGGFNMEYQSVPTYSKAIAKNPALNHEFIAACDKYKRMKMDNPGMVLRGKDDLVPARILELSNIQEDEMEGEKEFFCRLDAYTKKFGLPPKDQIVSHLS